MVHVIRTRHVMQAWFVCRICAWIPGLDVFQTALVWNVVLIRSVVNLVVHVMTVTPVRMGIV